MRHVDDFDHLPIPFRAVATDMETGQPVILSHGDLAVALRSSMSVPGVFAPTEVDGHCWATAAWWTTCRWTSRARWASTW